MTKLDKVLIQNKIQHLSTVNGLKVPQIEIILAQERFMARVGSMEEGRFFIWKGGSLILRLYRTLPTPRFTIDLDLFLHGYKIDQVTDLLQKISSIDLNDGFKFEGLKHEPMKRETPYGGTRYKIKWSFFKSPRSQSLNIDICAGDVVNPKKIFSNEIFLLDIDHVPISFSVYPPEYIFAEKLETIFRFKTGNTRSKDFIDLFTLANHPLDRDLLVKAIVSCFKNRNTNFNLSLLEKILTDKLFLEDLELRRQRNFPTLNLPKMHDIAKVIFSLLKELNL